MTRSAAAALVLAALTISSLGTAAHAAEPAKGAAELGRLLAQAPRAGEVDAEKGAGPAKRHLLAAIRASAESSPAAQ